jgi:2-polyprenyl-3-methyl-5-hydroxy-6-metoxy-1,4-benzoquinol methylase
MNSESSLNVFDNFASDYGRLVTENVQITGEPAGYFAAYKAAYVARRIAPPLASKILDFGCGIGTLSEHLRRMLHHCQIDGFDVSKESVKRIDQALLNQGRFTVHAEHLHPFYDVVVLSNVLHHVKPADRERVVSEAASLLAPNGKLVIFEHNPINPFTRWAVSQCPLDADAILLRSGEPQKLLGTNLRVLWRDYIVFFPRWLKWFRRFEPLLRWCPLGAQYAVAAERQG